MTNMDTQDALDKIVGEALRAHAAQAPELAPDWPGIDRMSTAPMQVHRQRRFTLIASAAAVALVVGGLTAVALTRNAEITPATAPTTWVPDGTEFPLTDLGPATAVFDGPAAEALTRQIGVPGHPPQIITTSLTYDGTNTATEQFCTWEQGGGGCRMEWGNISWSTSQTSSIDNKVADYDLWTVEGLPAEAAFVSYDDGDQHLWQRPIAGFAAFPNVEGNSEIVIAYNQLGDELGRYGIAENAATVRDVVPPRQADVSKAEYSQLLDTTANSMSTCLTANGGTINAGNVATFADDVDQIAVWNDCVATVKEQVTDAVNQIGPRYFDPATERPENPDPATVYND
jgi:hypothetical protein